jgi:hypothetical protein
VGRTFALRRAFELLKSILADYPDYRGQDQVLFHMAQCYAKLMDYSPAKTVDVWVYPDWPAKDSKEGRLEYAHRRVGELFQRVVDEFPESGWAEASSSGAAYRFKMVRILRAKREKTAKRKAGGR